MCQIHTFKTEIVLSMLFSRVTVYGSGFSNYSPNDVRNTVATLSPQHIRLFISVSLQTLIRKNIHSYTTTFIFLCSFTYVNSSFLTRKPQYLTEQGRMTLVPTSGLQRNSDIIRTFIPEHWKRLLRPHCFKNFYIIHEIITKSWTKAFSCFWKDAGKYMHTPDQAYL